MDLQLGRRTTEPHNCNAMTYDITNLKARAYDIISAIEQLQRELQSVNVEIARKVDEHVKATQDRDNDA